MAQTAIIAIGGYLIACVVAWTLHELAHYAVHSVYALSVTAGLNRYGPYVDAVYNPAAPTAAIRLGSLAPTLIYTPFVLLGITVYVNRYPLPELTPTGWTMVAVPIAILITPTAADIQSCRNAPRTSA